MQYLKPSSSTKNSELESKLMSTPNENPGSKSNELVDRFDKSLQELKDLRSQLHYAADYCEKTFLKTKEKKMVMEDTKEYICRAMITVVDHLGSVSSNLDLRISESNEVSESELRLHCLKQRLLTCQQYAQNLALSKVRWTNNLPRHLPHYVINQNANLEESKGNVPLHYSSRDVVDSEASKIMSKYKIGSVDEKLALSLYKNPHKPSLAMDNYGFKKLSFESISGFSSGFGILSKLLPIREAPASPSIYRNPYFQFQAETKKQGRNEQNRRLLQITRRTKRTM